jgi:S-DNA-T family DNA segregation ATPase FtsK/SpoIIIE
VITGLIKANFPSRIAFAVTSQIDSRVILDTHGADRLLGRGDMLYMAADAAKLVRIQGTFVSDSEVERIVEFWRHAKPPDNETDAAQAPRRSRQQAEYESHNEARQAARQAEQAAPEPAAEQSAVAEPPSEASLPAETPRASQQDTGERADAMAYQPPAAFLSGDEQDELLPQALDLVRQHQRASASLLQRRLRIGYSKAAQLIDLLEQQGVVGPAEGGRSREVLQRADQADG